MIHKHELFIKRININKIEKIIISRGLQKSNNGSLTRHYGQKKEVIIHIRPRF